MKLVLLAATVACLAQARTPEEATEKVKEGKQLFEQRCGFCHLPGGTGTIMLARRLGKDRALLAERTDLTTDYIEKITRVGINSMPPHNRIELPDRELGLIAIYLTRPASERAPDEATSTDRKP